MGLKHIINGEYVNRLSFEVQSPFANVSYRMKLPRLQEKEADYALHAVHTAKVPCLEERRNVVCSLANYQPSQETLEAMCFMTGAPISIVRERISEGKELVARLAQREDIYQGNNQKKVFVAIPSNDPREVFYFTAHAILAGTPTILKPSKKEPVLAKEIVSYLLGKGIPRGYLNVMYGDSQEKEDAEILRKVVQNIDLPIVMGDAKISEKQITFNADHSRGLILDATYALAHLSKSVEAPLSCLAEHNYVIVGERNFDLTVQRLKEIYSSMKEGDLLNRNTRRGLIEESTLEQAAALLSEGRANDSLKILYPLGLQEGKINPETIKQGVIVEHFSEDSNVGVNPLMDTVLPFYITCVRKVDSVNQALADLERAKISIQRKYNVEKSMAMAIYDTEERDTRSNIESLAFDVHRNESPMYVDGWRHQGINLHEVLTR